MTTPPVARLFESEHGRQVWVWCPGCDLLHPFTIESDGLLNGGTTWEWNGNLERPTFSPSLLCKTSVHICEGEHDPIVCDDPEACAQASHSIGAIVDGEARWRFPHGMPDDAAQVYGHDPGHTRDPCWGDCHSFLRDGRWEFLSDSAHHLAGQTVDMVPGPDYWRTPTTEETP